MFFLVFLLLTLLAVLLFKMVYGSISVKAIKRLSEDPYFNDLAKDLPGNIEVCQEMLAVLDNKKTRVRESKTAGVGASFYLHMEDVILLSSKEENKSNFTRFLFLAHECIHSIQSKGQLWVSFILSNITLWYFGAISAVKILHLMTSGEVYYLTSLVFLCLVTLFARVTVEADASYRSIGLAAGYLEKKLGREKANEIGKRYEELIYGNIPAYFFSMILPMLMGIAVFSTIIIVS